MDILIGDPLTMFVHHASLEHRGCALPMQIDPAWYIGLGHAIAPANVFGHLSCEGFDIRDHGKRSLYVGFPDHPGLTWTNEGAISFAGAARWRLLVVRFNQFERI